MKRTMATALALGALSVALLTGCDRAKAEPPAPQPATGTATSTTRAITPPAANAPAAPNVDAQLNDVDGLLDQVDGQLKADGQNAPDAD
jgi:uncharacterized lipoprotein YbaY